MKNLYFNLAINGIRKNKEVYLPFSIAFIMLVSIFGTMLNIMSSDNLASHYGVSTLKQLLFLGLFIMTIFSTIFLVYANGFIMKKRSNEFGLYNVLGLEKKQITRIVVIEAMLVGVISILLGILVAAIFYKLSEGLFFKFMRSEVESSFIPNIMGPIITTLVFLGVNLLIIINRVIDIRKSSTIELLKKSKISQKNRLSAGLLGLLGVILIGIGYYIALTIGSPLINLGKYLLAILLVIFGTFLGFSSISSVILNALAKNKNYYYKTNNFVSVSGLKHRIKQNASGLASICVMSCTVLVLIGTSFALYFGLDMSIKAMYPRTINYELFEVDQAEKEGIEKLFVKTDEILKKYNVQEEDILEVSYLKIFGDLENKSLINIHHSFGARSSDKAIYLIDIRNLRGYEDLNINEGEGYYYSENGHIIEDLVLPSGNINLVKKLDKFDYVGSINRISLFDSIFIFVKDIDKIIDENKSDNMELYKMGYFGFDLSDNIKDEVYEEIRSENYQGAHILEKEARMKDFLQFYGALFFIGTFLGLAFILGTGLVIYYKQLSEGYEDIYRFSVYRNVGMTEKEVKKSIQSQVKTFFFLPPLVAGLHIGVMFRSISGLLNTLGVFSLKYKIIAFIIVYVVYLLIYFVIYRLTSKAYYRIIWLKTTKSKR